MRSKEELVRLFAETDPGSMYSDGKEPDTLTKEKSKYIREKVLLEVMLDLRELMKE